MFYVVFLTFGYISLGLGVWIAMRHKAELRHSVEQESDNKNQTNEFSPLYQMLQEEVQNGEKVITKGSGDTPPVIVDEQMRLNSSTPSATEVQLIGDMTEQLVGMAEDSEPVELAAIVQQLQEIHNLASGTDVRCYVSEDAECFVTPDKEQYSTTAICRPKVGCKKIGNRERSVTWH